MRREIIHIEVGRNSRTPEIVHPQSRIARILTTIFIFAIALLIFAAVLIVGLSMMVLVWLMLLVTIAAVIARSFFIRASRRAFDSFRAGDGPPR